MGTIKTRVQVVASVGAFLIYYCVILPCPHPLNSGFLMDPPPFWAHNGALHTANKKACHVGLGDRFSTKGKLAKAHDFGLDLGGGGRAPGSACVDDT